MIQGTPTFFWIKKGKEKYLHLVMLLFFNMCFVFALSENRNVTYTTYTTQNPSYIEIKKRADSLFNTISIHINNGNFIEAEAAAEKSVTLSQSIEDKSGIGNCFNKIATISYYTANFAKALTYYDKSIAIYKEVHFQKGVASSLNNKGAIYYHLGNYPEALQHYKKALALNEATGTLKQQATALKNIGGIYLEVDELDKAMSYYDTARKMYKKIGNKKLEGQVISAIGEIYIAKEEYDVALKFLDNSLLIAQNVDDKQHIMVVTYTKATLKNTLKKHKEAIGLYNNVIDQASRLDNERYIAMSYIGRGKAYFELHNRRASLADCQKGFLIAKKLNVIAVEKEACDCLYQTHKSIANPKKALFFYEASITLQDSLKTTKTSNKVLQMEFEKEQLLDSIFQVEKERNIASAHRETLQKKKNQRNVLLISGCFILVIAGVLWSRLKFIKTSKAKLQIEKDRSEHLLLNILPEEIAEELKVKGYVDAQDVDTATILFTDFKSFTETASKLTPQELVEEINVCFKAFDAIIEKYHIEKIKTIGDAYMAAGGLPQPDVNAVKNTILAALAMQEFILKRKQKSSITHKPAFEMRVGVHVGPIVAGIVGVKKFQYDVWGDTVNTASRMESNGEVGKVNISEDTYVLIKDEPDFTFTYRGKLEVKGKGVLAMYFVSKK